MSSSSPPTQYLYINYRGQVRTVEFLVSQGAYKDARNTNKQGAVHLAVSVATQNKVEMLKTLKKLKFDVNQQVRGRNVVYQVFQQSCI